MSFASKNIYLEMYLASKTYILKSIWLPSHISQNLFGFKNIYLEMYFASKKYIFRYVFRFKKIYLEMYFTR